MSLLRTHFCWWTAKIPKPCMSQNQKVRCWSALAKVSMRFVLIRWQCLRKRTSSLNWRTETLSSSSRTASKLKTRTAKRLNESLFTSIKTQVLLKKALMSIICWKKSMSNQPSCANLQRNISMKTAISKLKPTCWRQSKQATASTSLLQARAIMRDLSVANCSKSWLRFRRKYTFRQSSATICRFFPKNLSSSIWRKVAKRPTAVRSLFKRMSWATRAWRLRTFRTQPCRAKQAIRCFCMPVRRLPLLRQRHIRPKLQSKRFWPRNWVKSAELRLPKILTFIWNLPKLQTRCKRWLTKSMKSKNWLKKISRRRAMHFTSDVQSTMIRQLKRRSSSRKFPMSRLKVLRPVNLSTVRLPWLKKVPRWLQSLLTKKPQRTREATFRKWLLAGQTSSRSSHDLCQMQGIKSCCRMFIRCWRRWFRSCRLSCSHTIRANSADMTSTSLATLQRAWR